MSDAPLHPQQTSRNVPTLIHDGKAWVRAENYDRLFEVLLKIADYEGVDPPYVPSGNSMARWAREAIAPTGTEMDDA